MTTPTIRITVEDTLDAGTTEEFYGLYAAAFGPLRDHAAARQVLTHEEFAEIMTDARVAKYIAWDEDWQPLGITTISNDLDTVAWISPEFYAARYPEHFARRALYYIGFALAHPGKRRQGVFLTMLDAILARFARESAVCLYDICEHNNEAMNFADVVRMRGEHVTDVTVRELDAQTYYGARFHGSPFRIAEPEIATRPAGR